MFAGSCIGVICLVLCLEFLRRVGREYDAFILRRARLRRMYLSGFVAAANKRNYQSINAGEDNNSRTADCGRCCKAHPFSSAEDDLIAPAPVSSEQSSTSQKKTTEIDPVKTASSSGAIVTQARDAEAAALEPYRPSLVEQLIRALLHMLQFAVAYFIMLLAMYFNGYIIICIFIGAFLGSLVFSWEPVSLNKE